MPNNKKGSVLVFVPSLFLVDQLLNNVIKVENNCLVLLNDVLHLLLLFFFLPLKSLNFALLPFGNPSVKTQLHPFLSLLDLDVSVAQLLQK